MWSYATVNRIPYMRGLSGFISLSELSERKNERYQYRYTEFALILPGSVMFAFDDRLELIVSSHYI